MRLPHRNTIPRLETACATMFRGLPLRDWAEHVATGTLEKAGQNAPPPNLLAKRLLRERRILKLSYQVFSHGHGHLIEGDEGFELEVRLTRPDGGFWHQFTIAHEIAHTFLYDLSQWPPRRGVNLRRDDRDLEWLCDYLAKCLTIPASWLCRDLERYPTLGEEGFSLAVVKALSDTFGTPGRLIAERLVEDLSMWKCVMVLFRKLIEPSRSSDDTWRFTWRQTWNTVPTEGTAKLFLPLGRRTESGRMKFPRAKGSMRQLVETWINESERSEAFELKRIPWKLLNSTATGNLGSYAHDVLRTNEIPVYIAVRRPSTTRLFEWMPSKTPLPLDQILICLPLTGTHRHH